MKYLDYLHNHIRKVIVIYGLIAIVFMFWMVFGVLRKVEVKSNSQVPTYSVSTINSINERLEARSAYDLPKYNGILESEYGKEEPFR